MQNYHVGYTKLAKESICDEPSNFKQVAQDPNWQVAMWSQIDLIHQNGTWSLMLIPLGKRLITTKWVFKLKVGVDGRSHKHKTRLVAHVYKGENILGWYH